MPRVDECKYVVHWKPDGFQTVYNEIDPINDLPAGLPVTRLYPFRRGRITRWVTIPGDCAYITTGGGIRHDPEREVE